MRTDKKLWRNRKARKELARQLQSENPGLEVAHPHAAGIDVGNSAHYVAVLHQRERPGTVESRAVRIARHLRGDLLHKRCSRLDFDLPRQGSHGDRCCDFHTPFTYSAVNFSTITPSGSVIVLSNAP